MSESLKLKGKVAAITGAGSGIGAATAKLFTQYGAAVSLLSRTEQPLAETVEECQRLNVGQPMPLMTVGNVGDQNTCMKFIEETVRVFGQLDILVNNAGMNILSTIENLKFDDFDTLININLKAPIYLTQLARPHLIKTKGSIINISSVGAHKISTDRVLYGMAKVALNHFTKYAAKEFGPYQVRVNSVCPGWTMTKFPKWSGISENNLQEYFDSKKKFQALNRCAEGKELADVVAFLASDESSFITGSDIIADGGHLIM